jgi:ribosomal protein S18 acetylase RimI-like enzyme
MRRAGAGDAAAIRSLTRDVYAKWIPSIGREPRPMVADYDAAVRQHWIELHEEDGELLALIEMVPAADHLWIQNIAVSVSQQGNGLGRALLAHAEKIAQTMGLEEIRLNTNAAFAANLAFYRHMGFSETGREPLPDGGTMVHFTKPVS